MTLGVLRPVTDADFADVVLGAVGPVLVSFTSQACPADYVEDLAAHAPWLTCVRLDVDRWPLTAAAYRVLRLPTLLVFSSGVPVMTLDGVQPPDVARRLVEALRT